MAKGLGDHPLGDLRRPHDPELEAQHEEDVRRRLHAQHERAQHRLAELIDSNATLPTTLSSITVLNANRTRRGFLSRIFEPLLSANHDVPYTLQEALLAISSGVGTLQRFDIFEHPISAYFERPDPTDSSSTPTDLSAFISVRERPRLLASAGAWAGSNDGSVQSSLLFRNLFGGAESLSASASRGTRLRSSYTASFDTPILSNPDLNFNVTGFANATSKPWASHDESTRGGLSRLRYSPLNGYGSHELAYQGIWRQITNLAANASPTVRNDAGDSFKSSLAYTWLLDRRNNARLPTSGYMLKSHTEVAGVGPLKGDVAFTKFELEAQAALPVPVPLFSNTGTTGVSFTAGLRGGLLYPLRLSDTSDSATTHSRINDRFTLGGPTDVRGFRLAGLGPRDGEDSVGGDVYAAGGASLYFPFPRVGPEVPLRMQVFVNGGRLVGLQDVRKASVSDKKTEGAAAAAAGSSDGMSATDVRESVISAVRELGNELPSVAAGVGVVYAMEEARFEMNFSVPLVVRKGEEVWKGLGFGVGISFL